MDVDHPRVESVIRIVQLLVPDHPFEGQNAWDQEGVHLVTSVEGRATGLEGRGPEATQSGRAAHEQGPSHDLDRFQCHPRPIQDTLGAGVGLAHSAVVGGVTAGMIFEIAGRDLPEKPVVT